MYAPTSDESDEKEGEERLDVNLFIKSGSFASKGAIQWRAEASWGVEHPQAGRRNPKAAAVPGDWKVEGRAPQGPGLALTRPEGHSCCAMALL